MDMPDSVNVSAGKEGVEVSFSRNVAFAQGSIELTLSINGSADSFSNGFYEASIEFRNLYNNDGNVIKPATLTVGTPQPVYTWDLSEDPGWSMQGEWGFGQPTGGGGGSLKMTSMIHAPRAIG